MTKSNKVKKISVFSAVTAVCLLLFTVVSVLFQCYKYHFSGIPDVVNSTTDGMECSLTVTANALRIEDKKAFADEIFSMCRTNSFRTLKLSTDVSGWPSRLYVVVYLHRNEIGRKEPEMRIRYIPPDGSTACNIKDDGEKYRVIIE